MGQCWKSLNLMPRWLIDWGNVQRGRSARQGQSHFSTFIYLAIYVYSDAYSINVYEYVVIKTYAFGFPQESVLGVKIFKWYSVPFGTIARRHGLYCHIYVYAKLLHQIISPTDLLDKQQSIAKIQNSISDMMDILFWMTAIYLKCHDKKSEVE